MLLTARLLIDRYVRRSVLTDTFYAMVVLSVVLVFGNIFKEALAESASRGLSFPERRIAAERLVTQAAEPASERYSSQLASSSR